MFLNIVSIVLFFSTIILRFGLIKPMSREHCKTMCIHPDAELQSRLVLNGFHQGRAFHPVPGMELVERAG